VYKAFAAPFAFTTNHRSFFLMLENLPGYLPDYFLEILYKNDNIKDYHKKLRQMEK